MQYVLNITEVGNSGFIPAEYAKFDNKKIARLFAIDLMKHNNDVVTIVVEGWDSEYNESYQLDNPILLNSEHGEITEYNAVNDNWELVLI